MTGMSADDRDAFLKQVRIATLVTLDGDGSPNALPLWYEWDGEKAYMFSSRATGKVRRLSRDPRACLSVHDPVGALESWVSIEGIVEIQDNGGRELACKLAAIYYQPERAQATIAKWSTLEDWVLLVLTPTRIRTY